MQAKITAINLTEKVLLEREPFQNEKEAYIFKNEEYGVQLVVHSDTDFLCDAKLRVTTDAPGGCRVCRVQHVPAATPIREFGDDYVISGQAGLYPDVLTDADTEHLYMSRGQYHSFVVTVNERMEISSGRYTIFAELVSEQGEPLDRLTTEFTVIDETLPKLDVVYTNWIHYDCICEKHGVTPWTDAFFKVFGAYLETAVRYGQNTVYVPLFTPPLDTEIGGERRTIQLVDVERNNGNYVFRFDKLKKFMHFCATAGIKYFEFSHLFTQWGAKSAPKIIVREDGEERREFGWDEAATGEKYASFLSCCLPELVRFLEDGDVLEQSLLHLSDEPKVAELEQYKRCRELIVPFIGKLKTADALSNIEFAREKTCSIPIVSIAAADEFLANGYRDIFVYYCSGEIGRHLSNRMLSMPLPRTRMIGLQIFHAGVKGFLHWGYNFYNDFLSRNSIDPFAVTDCGGVFSSGDPFVVYPDVKRGGVFQSLRWKALYQGFCDYRTMCLLSERKGREYCISLLERAGVISFTEYPTEPEFLYRFMTEVKKEIQKLSKDELKANR